MTWKMVHYASVQRENRTEIAGLAHFVWFTWCQTIRAAAQKGWGLMSLLWRRKPVSHSIFRKSLKTNDQL